MDGEFFSVRYENAESLRRGDLLRLRGPKRKINKTKSSMISLWYELWHAFGKAVRSAISSPSMETFGRMCNAPPAGWRAIAASVAPRDEAKAHRPRN